MLIESLIRRRNGTRVTLDSRPYAFMPDSSGRHVCEVEEPAHIQRFLSIAEGFAIADDQEVRSELPKIKTPPKVRTTKTDDSVSA